MIRDPYQAFEIYKQGGLDFIGDPTTPLPPDLIKIPDVQSELVEKSIPRIFWIHCNLRQFPLNNRFLRQALSFAINRKSLTEKVFLHQTPQFSPLPTKYATVQGNEKGNPQLAVELFEKALKDLGHTHSSFPTLVLTHSDLSFEKPLFEELKAQWKDVLGINIAPRQLRWTEFSAAIEKGNFQLCGLFRRDFFNNALFYLSFFKPSPSNPHSLDNPVYLNLLNQLEQGKMQEGILKEIEQLLIEEMPVIPLVNQRFLALIASHVKGIGWDANGCLDLKEVSIHENSH
jgi:oligopeptide transport system substrate-binding protein